MVLVSKGIYFVAIFIVSFRGACALLTDSDRGRYHQWLLGQVPDTKTLQAAFENRLAKNPLQYVLRIILSIITDIRLAECSIFLLYIMPVICVNERIEEKRIHQLYIVQASIVVQCALKRALI